ncbi:antirestriction protein ArdA [Chakrabartyella piscis]|uniref:antirestriction protein ArdA n=1 Tax=Chakrabartyella piscis TaxID=2918914 RepID=UPI0029583258|nr:antirestriction protein ArdA [Chakrabartyella piscis]
MRLRIQQPTTKKQMEITLPATEKQLQTYCDELSIDNNMQSRTIVTEIPFEDKMNTILTGNQYNLTELNFLFQSVDRFTDEEMKVFYTVATAKNLTDIKDLINLSFNEQCYSVVTDFSDIDRLGRKLYLNENGAASEEELQSVDGQQYIEKMIADNPNPLVSPYGLVYPNQNQSQDIYFGKAFPQYLNGFKVFDVALRTDTSEEYLDLPCEESEIQKAMERLEVASLDDTSITILYHNLPDKIEDILHEIECDLQPLNESAKTLHQVGEREYDYLEKLAIMTKINTVQELDTLCHCMHEFEVFPNIHTPEAYGQYMICDSGRYEYDENLEEYIDFKRYGENRIANEVGTFTKQGYMTYMGYNPEMAEILNRNLNMNIQNQTYSETLKLYMPLKVVTYEEENDWGQYETSDYEEELDSCELCGYEDELENFIKSYGDHIPEERGLMEYYDTKDSVNAKVESFKFEFEQMDGNVYGVAACELKAPLDATEMATLKEYITGQASDGFGEGLEQEDFNLCGRNVNISLWDINRYFLRTAEEMGFREQVQRDEFDMMMQ